MEKRLEMRARVQRSHERHARAAARLRKKKAPLHVVPMAQQYQEDTDITSSSSSSAAESEMLNLPRVPDSHCLTYSTSTFLSAVNVPADSGCKSTTSADDFSVDHLKDVQKNKMKKKLACKRGSLSDSCLTVSNRKEYAHHNRHYSDTTLELSMVEQKIKQRNNFSIPRIPNIRRDTPMMNISKKPLRLKPLQIKAPAERGDHQKVATEDSDGSTATALPTDPGLHDQVLVTVTSPTTPASKKPFLPVYPNNLHPHFMPHLLREKTRGMNLSENILMEVQEMSKHLDIVNWLLEPKARRHDSSLCKDNQAARKDSLNASSLTNLVMVRQGSLNWFDVPREFLVSSEENDELDDNCRDDPESCLTPLSVHSELLSDDEEEIRKINFDILNL